MRLRYDGEAYEKIINLANVEISEEEKPEEFENLIDTILKPRLLLDNKYLEITLDRPISYLLNCY